MSIKITNTNSKEDLLCVCIYRVYAKRRRRREGRRKIKRREREGDIAYIKHAIIFRTLMFPVSDNVKTATCAR